MSLITYKIVNSLWIRILSPSTFSPVNCKGNDSESYCIVACRFIFQVKASTKNQATLEGICSMVSRKVQNVDCLVSCS